MITFILKNLKFLCFNKKANGALLGIILALLAITIGVIIALKYNNSTSGLFSIFNSFGGNSP